jgi:hypothetical protein
MIVSFSPPRRTTSSRVQHLAGQYLHGHAVDSTHMTMPTTCSSPLTAVSGVAPFGQIRAMLSNTMIRQTTSSAALKLHAVLDYVRPEDPREDERHDGGGGRLACGATYHGVLSRG